ncbi:MAG: lytic murein transglycosylase [Exilibacterium sp.]
MTNRALLPAVEMTDMDELQVVDCCAYYRQRQDALHLIKQLNRLTSGVQRHRGLSMALLSGDKRVQDEFAALQKQVDKRIAVLRAFARQSGDLISTRDQERLDNAWMTIKTDWHDDAVMDNFELHSHFIEQLLGLTTELAKRLEKPIFEYLTRSMGTDAKLNTHLVHKQLGLLAFACRQMPDMVELVAKIRGLATHVIVIGRCDFHQERKLRYLLQCTRVQNEKLRTQIDRMAASIKDNIASLPMVKAYDLKLMFLLNNVEQDVLKSSATTTDRRQLFELASQIIDVYVNVISDGLDLLQAWQERQLDDWCTMRSP